MLCPVHAFYTEHASHDKQSETGRICHALLVTAAVQLGAILVSGRGVRALRRLIRHRVGLLLDGELLLQPGRLDSGQPADQAGICI